MKFWNLAKAGQEAELRIDGDIIDNDDIWLYEWLEIEHSSPNEFRSELTALGDQPLTVWIDSYGGSVFAAVGIYNALKAYPGRVTVVIDSKAMSAATIIAMAGDRIEITSGAIFMVHNPLSAAAGYAEDLRKTADVLDTVKEAIVNIYAERTGLGRDEISRLMDEETYMGAAQTVTLGFADAVRRVPEDARPAAWNVRRLAVVNRAAVDLTALQTALAEPKPEPEPENDPCEPPLVDKSYSNMIKYLEVEELLNA